MVGTLVKQRGMTLVELMIVMVIVAILLGVGVPSYRGYIQRSNRADATTALMRIAANQERHYLQYNRYAGTLDGGPPAGLNGRITSDRDFYNLTMVVGDATADFTVTASIAPGGKQKDDDDCQTFTLDEQGLRGATGNATDPVEECWR